MLDVNRPHARDPLGTATARVPVEHERANLDPWIKARECAYEHAGVVLETLKRLGHQVAIHVPYARFQELEGVERCHRRVGSAGPALPAARWTAGFAAARRRADHFAAAFAPLRPALLRRCGFAAPGARHPLPASAGLPGR